MKKYEVRIKRHNGYIIKSFDITLPDTDPLDPVYADIVKKWLEFTGEKPLVEIIERT